MLFKFKMVLVNLLLITAAGCKANKVAESFNETKSSLEEVDTFNNASRVDSLYELANRLLGSLQPGTDLEYLDFETETKRNETKVPNSNISQRMDKDFYNELIRARDRLPANCAEAMRNESVYGLFKIQDERLGKRIMEVICKKDDDGIPWLLIQRRSDGSVDFYRKMKEYIAGFGNLYNEFFLGLKNIHALTSLSQQELWIQLEDWDGEERWAKYSNFKIGDAESGYDLKSVGHYSGDANDSLTYHVGSKWSTKDKGIKKNCANKYKGAWWYRGCHKSNLNGLYSPEQYGQGIVWRSWHGFAYSLKYVHMAIRPVFEDV